MELKMSGGKYAVGAGGLQTVAGAGELAQRVTMKLTARRGGFAPLTDYGSRLWTLPAIKPSQRAGAVRQFAAEALAGEPDVSLEDIELTEPGDGTLLVKLTFSTPGGSFDYETEVGQ